MLYKSQSHHDTAIKSFRDVCNGYLNEKHYEYNESAVDLRIFSNEENGDKKEVLLSQLSSGEKQIVSLFSKIYLEPDNNFIVLFDEPELSLSIFWQKKLLPDILKSDRCDFLLAVTHSPFIFENELQKHNWLKEFFLKQSKMSEVEKLINATENSTSVAYHRFVLLSENHGLNSFYYFVGSVKMHHIIILEYRIS